MSRDLRFPYEFINLDLIRDVTGRPYYVIQAKLKEAGNPKAAVVFMEDAQGLHEVMRIREIYGPPRFFPRGNGIVIVSGPTHESPQRTIHHSDPVPGLLVEGKP